MHSALCRFYVPGKVSNKKESAQEVKETWGSWQNMYREKKIEASEKLWKHALLKPENTAIGALKVFDTERPYDCVGGWAEQHCVSRQGRDILTAGMLSIVNYQDLHWQFFL